VKVGPALPPRTVWPSIITIDGSAFRPCRCRILVASRRIAVIMPTLVAPASPLAPHGLPVGEAIGQVAPLAAGPGEPQDRADDVAPRDGSLDATMHRRIEQVLDEGSTRRPSDPPPRPCGHLAADERQVEWHERGNSCGINRLQALRHARRPAVVGPISAPPPGDGGGQRYGPWVDVPVERAR